MKNKMMRRMVSMLAAGVMLLSVPVHAEEYSNTVLSELTNLPISAELQNQRPVAIVVDNESIALNHYGTNQADIVYELMNSTKNDRITRLMAIVKDWKNLKMFGSIRSARPTNFMLAAEYNAIIVHDGGPFYINDYLERDYTNSLSGGFARVPNGKATEFTEYVTSDTYVNRETGVSYPGLAARIQEKNYSVTYNEHFQGNHFLFGEDPLSGYYDAVSAQKVSLPFYHNGSELVYNAETATYDYYEYGTPHVDALDGTCTSFKNVIIQNCDFTEQDENGYMIYNLTDSTVHNGYYLKDGYMIPITWNKYSENGITDFYNGLTGEDLMLASGKTYIALVPSDTWSDVVIG